MPIIVGKSKDSLLTTSSGYTNYRGILNLVIILLVLSNARAALENLIKYGLLVDPISWFEFLSDGSRHWPAYLITSTLCLHILTALVIELVLVASGNNKFALALLVTNLLSIVCIPPMIVFSHSTHPISSSAVLMLASIVLLKLVSYHMMNYWARDVRLPPEKRSRITRSFLKTYTPPAIEFGIVDSAIGGEEREATTVSIMNKIYPNNLTLSNMLDFIFVPTLCYEFEYARTSNIRTRFLLKRTIELIMLTQLDIALVQQWIVPTVENSVLPFKQMNLSLCVERLLKLAIPNHIIWLIWFYLFFHSLLNIIAELTRFADREFYRDWWNSESVYYFWSNWNIPVHKWCARHLYVPLISLGFTKCQASTAVFFVSAFFHEYLLSVPLKMFRMWAFMGMLMQLPLARLVSAYFNSNFANVAVWVSLIMGQPLCILMYYHDYYIINAI